MRQLIFILVLLVSSLSSSQSLTKEEIIGVWQVKNMQFLDIICRFGQKPRSKVDVNLVESTIQFDKNGQLYFYPINQKIFKKKEIHLKWEFNNWNTVSLYNSKDRVVCKISIKYTEENIFFYCNEYKFTMQKI